MNREEKFNETYDKNLFKGNESKSGRGSDMDIVSPLIPKLTSLLNKYNVKTLIDAPCGDYNWINKVLVNTNINKYIGIDIVEQLIQDNIKLYSNGFSIFQKMDLVEEIPPKGDLILCRDCLVHLSFDSAKKVIKNIIESETPLILLTTFTNDRQNSDFEDGNNWYPMKLTQEPFNFPAPIEIINEECMEAEGNFQDKSLGLWQRKDLINYVEYLNS